MVDSNLKVWTQGVYTNKTQVNVNNTSKEEGEVGEGEGVKLLITTVKPEDYYIWLKYPLIWRQRPPNLCCELELGMNR